MHVSHLLHSLTDGVEGEGGRGGVLCRATRNFNNNNKQADRQTNKQGSKLCGC